MTVLGKHVPVVTALATLALIQAGAADLSPLSSAKLLELCRVYVRAPETEEGRSCASYVRGFIDGSSDVVLRVENATVTRPESFSERAWRTRLGIRPPSPKYCIAEEISLREFIEQMLEHAEHKPPEPDVGASALLYGALSRFHRCARYPKSDRSISTCEMVSSHTPSVVAAVHNV